MLEARYLGTVREQYENYPYPYRDPEDERKRLIHTILAALPPTNWFKKAEQKQIYLNTNRDATDIDIYDCLLHSQDRAYTVLELYDWLDECELHLAAFADAGFFYRPETIIDHEALFRRIRMLPTRQQQAIAELITVNHRLKILSLTFKRHTRCLTSWMSCY